MREPTLAQIVDECEHGSTASLCPACKRPTREAERRARQRRRANEQAWSTDSAIPYPSVEAEYRSLCKGCDEWITEGDTIFRVRDSRTDDSCWVCEDCARDCAVVKGDGCCG